MHSEVFKDKDFADESDDISHFADRDLSIGTDVVKRVMRMNNSGDEQCHNAGETDHFSQLDRHHSFGHTAADGWRPYEIGQVSRHEDDADFVDGPVRMPGTLAVEIEILEDGCTDQRYDHPNGKRAQTDPAKLRCSREHIEQSCGERRVVITCYEKYGPPVDLFAQQSLKRPEKHDGDSVIEHTLPKHEIIEQGWCIHVTKHRERGNGIDGRNEGP